LFITHGLPGSGKTFQSQRLSNARSDPAAFDVERKRLFGLGMLEDSHARAWTCTARRRPHGPTVNCSRPLASRCAPAFR
jgi:predicted kinase